MFFGKAAGVNGHTSPVLNSLTFHALDMDDLNGAAWNEAAQGTARF